MRLSKIGFIIISHLICLLSQGQVLKGGDISIKNVTGNTYYILARIAINWPVSINKPYVKVNWGDGSPLDSLVYGDSDCTLHGATTLYYYGNHNFSPNNTYTVSIIDSFFISNIVNIPNSSSVKMYLHSELNTNAIYQPNISVNTHVCLTDSVRCCNLGAYNPGATDADGDSLSYSLVIPPYANYIQPPVMLDPLTGTLTFTANPGGPTSVSIKIDEWRSISSIYYKIASTYQELFFKVYNSVGIKETGIGNLISVYPNPTSSTLNITSDQNQFQNSYVEIKNTLGQTILSLPFKPEIDVSTLSNGLYFLQISTQDKRLLNAKFIKE